MTIQKITTEIFHIPLPKVLSDSTHGDIEFFELISVRIYDSSGDYGLGYTYTTGTGGSAIASHIKDDFSSILIGIEPNNIEEIWNKLWWHVHFAGRGGAMSFAISAVDIALWDLKGKQESKPIWKILGGENPNVQVYAGGVDLQFTMHELITQTESFLNNGFNAIKMKIGRQNISKDIERIAKIRSVLGNNRKLMVDANMNWTVDQAIQAARLMQPYNVFWFEEPTIPEDIEGHIRIQNEGGIPIATGENFHNVFEFEHFISSHAVSFPEPDVATIGGITAWMKVAKMALKSNLPITSHGVHDLHVHLLAAAPNSSMMEVHAFGLENYIVEPLQIVNGNTIAPNRPGHGVEFDFEKLTPLRIGNF